MVCSMVSLFPDGPDSQLLLSVPSGTPNSGPHHLPPVQSPEPPYRSLGLGVFSPLHLMLSHQEDPPKTDGMIFIRLNTFS